MSGNSHNRRIEQRKNAKKIKINSKKILFAKTDLQIFKKTAYEINQLSTDRLKEIRIERNRAIKKTMVEQGIVIFLTVLLSTSFFTVVKLRLNEIAFCLLLFLFLLISIFIYNWDFIKLLKNNQLCDEIFGENK